MVGEGAIGTGDCGTALVGYAGIHQIARGWLVRPMVKIIQPGPRHRDILLQFLKEVGARSNLLARFSGLRFRNPLV